MRRSRNRGALVGLVAVGGVLALAGSAAAMISRRDARAPEPEPEPTIDPASVPDIDLESLPMPRNVDPLDVEAAARMIRSENPRAPDAAKVEQIWTQLRARRRGQSLYARITGGHGYGSQGASRPVSTDAEATDADRELAARVLRGELPSALPDARKFFDPDEQDRAFRQVTKAKAALAAGQPITANDRRLLNAGYKRDAAAVREKWSSEGSRYVDVIGPVEFWT